MMDDLYKFGWLPNGQEEEPYQYPDVWVRESSDRMDRLAIAPRSGYVNLLADLASVLEEPFLLLYVLVVPRGQAEPGRYQSEYSFSLVQLEQFLSGYSPFFENDARHNLWIRPTSSEGLLVYDRHNIVYAYGPVEKFIGVLNRKCLTESKDQFLRYESPHVHHYHPEFDAYQDRLLTEEQWSISPLRPGDENPD